MISAARLILPMFLAILLTACGSDAKDPPGDGPSPAMWEISGPNGTVEGWMLGTIHALPDDFAWRTPLLDDRLGKADILAVEVAGLDDGKALQGLFRQMAYNHPGGPVIDRVAPHNRARYAQVLAAAKLRADQFDSMESWAAALALAQTAQDAEVENGVDRALLADFGKGEVVELEGAASQLRIFDTLPEKEQRDLLDAALDETAASDQEIGKLAIAWQAGDIEELARLTRHGILADPELRQALLVDRNRAWAAQIANLLSTPQKPFVAVGTGHLIGPIGLPKLLTDAGYTVTRIQ